VLLSLLRLDGSLASLGGNDQTSTNDVVVYEMDPDFGDYVEVDGSTVLTHLQTLSMKLVTKGNNPSGEPSIHLNILFSFPQRFIRLNLYSFTHYCLTKDL